MWLKAITDLIKNSLYYPLGIYNNIFHGVVRYERTKSQIIFAQNAILLHCPLHRKPYIPVFHFISYLSDYEIQIRKRRKCKSFPISSFTVALYFILFTLSCSRYLLLLSVLFLPNKMEGSKRTTTRTGHLPSSTKNWQKLKKKLIQPDDRKTVVKQYIKSL